MYRFEISLPKKKSLMPIQDCKSYVSIWEKMDEAQFQVLCVPRQGYLLEKIGLNYWWVWIPLLPGAHLLHKGHLDALESLLSHVPPADHDGAKVLLSNLLLCNDAQAKLHSRC